MRQDSRLSAVLHVLLHMAETARPMTSEELAKCMGTNPVVVRRTMAHLREAGLVRSEKGHGGGWTIACDLQAVSLGTIHAALGSPTIWAIGNRSENPQCLVEQSVNHTLDAAFRDAEALLLERLANVSLADLAAEFHNRLAAHKNSRRSMSDAV
jgi:DNA-binding IscR family transcriptional regulator